MKIVAIVLGALAWLVPTCAQLWMWQKFSLGRQSHGLLWLVVTLCSLLPAGALSIVGTLMWHRAHRAASRSRGHLFGQRVGLALIATPALVVTLLGLYVVARMVIAH